MESVTIFFFLFLHFFCAFSYFSSLVLPNFINFVSFFKEPSFVDPVCGLFDFYFFTFAVLNLLFLCKSKQQWAITSYQPEWLASKKSINNIRRRRCGEKGTLLLCWWEYKLVQSLWRTVWRFLKKLKTELPYDPTIPLLGTYPEKNIIWKDTYTPVFVQHCL